MHSRPPKFAFITLLWFFLSTLLTSCGMSSLPQDHRPVEFTAKPDPHGENKFPNWSISPMVLENEITRIVDTQQDKAQIGKATLHGVSGPSKTLVRFPELDMEATFKWKVSPEDGLDNYNNSIARELATYQLQKLFLDPEDYVVPTSLAFCYEQTAHNRTQKPIKPQISGSNCIFGNASLWLLDVEIVDEFYQESRFLKEPNYAYYLSNFNILTYLAAHRDARSANVLVSTDDKRRQVFSIDNSTTYGTTPYNPFVHNWNIIRVPALRKETIDRLRSIKRKDLDTLGVVAQLHKDSDNIFRHVDHGKNLDPEIPVRIQNNTVQFGLTKEQLDDIWERLQQLIEKVDSGKIPLF